MRKGIDTQHFAPAEVVLQAIDAKLQKCRAENTHIDSITFSGNGEPTVHPQFPEIIEGLLVIRDKYYPESVITCLSNATQLLNNRVRDALLRIENPMLKLDAGLPDLYRLINRPTIPITMEQTVEGLRHFHGKFIMQSMFLKGIIEDVPFDNTSEENVTAWLKIVGELRPKLVVLYSLDRETPAKQLVKVYKDDLEKIAARVRALGIEANVYE